MQHDVNYGRALMGDSLGFHILFVTLSIGLPFIVNVLEYIAWKRDSKRLYSFIHLLVDWMTVLVVTGVISGTIIAMQFSILWGPFVSASRPFVGKFFILEGYMFMIEIAFLAWYRISAGKMSRGRHWLVGLPITFGAIGSAVFITTVNAWMNNPSGIITSTTFFEITHSVSSYLLASVMIVIGWLAFRIWKTKTTQRLPHWLIYKLSVLGLGILIVLAVLGHQSAQNLAKTQPLKLAGIEILDKTQQNAPLRVGGSIDESGTANGGVVIPSTLSVLAGNGPAYTVTGLDSTPKDRWPMLIIHALFDVKMMLVGAVSAVIVGTIVIYRRRRAHTVPAWLAKVLVLSCGLGLVLIELGWMITEFGRQPWAINGVLLTKDAFTTNNSALGIGYLFPTMYVFLFVATAFALNVTTRAWRKRETITW